jgi:beta-galactosidase
MELGWPELDVMRAPTDNDGIQVGWMTGVGALGRWRRWGIDRMTAQRQPVRRTRSGAVERRVDWYPFEGGEPIVHRQRARVIGEVAARFDERVDVPARYRDLARVGVAFTLPPGFEQLEWFGLGPHDTYSDRCAAELARWRSSVPDQYVDFVFPQHHGTHHDTRWFELSGPDRPTLRVVADAKIAFDVSHYSVDDLAAARHITDLVGRPETFVHVDIAHRGLGTASCGPDTLDRYLVSAGRYRWSWEIRGARR